MISQRAARSSSGWTRVIGWGGEPYAPPFRKAEFDIMFDEGISKAGSALDMAEILEVTKKSGAWVLYGEEKLGQGKENARVFLKENPKVLAKIEKEILEKSLNSCKP